MIVGANNTILYDGYIMEILAQCCLEAPQVKNPLSEIKKSMPFSMILQKVDQFLRLFTIKKLLILF